MNTAEEFAENAVLLALFTSVLWIPLVAVLT